MQTFHLQENHVIASLSPETDHTLSWWGLMWSVKSVGHISVPVCLYVKVRGKERISENILGRKRLESNTNAFLSSLVMCQRRELTENNWILFWPAGKKNRCVLSPQSSCYRYHKGWEISLVPQRIHMIHKALPVELKKNLFDSGGNPLLLQKCPFPLFIHKQYCSWVLEWHSDHRHWKWSKNWQLYWLLMFLYGRNVILHKKLLFAHQHLLFTLRAGCVVM